MPTVTPLEEINELLFPYIAARLQSSDRSYWLPATVWFCGLLSEGKYSPLVAKVLQSRVVPSLILFLTEENDPELQVEAAKTLKYIASGTYVSTEVKIDQLVNSPHDTLWHLMLSNDYEVLKHTSCSLAVLSGCENVKTGELILKSGIFDLLLDLVRISTLTAVALQILGNIVGRDGYMIHRMIDSGITVQLRKCLAHDHVDVRKEACWMIANVTSGNGQCGHWIEELFREGLIEELVKIVKEDKFCVMEAAIRAISNATVGARLEHIRYMVSKDCIEVLCYLFPCNNQEILKVCLEGLENILKAGEAEKINTTDKNPYVDHIDRIGGWVVLMEVICYYEKKIFKKGFDIMRTYGIIPVNCGPEILSLDYASDCDDE